MFLLCVTICSCGWEPARKKQLWDVKPEIKIAAALKKKIVVHDTFIEFSESVRGYHLVVEYAVTSDTDCLPMRAMGFTNNYAFTVFSEGGMLTAKSDREKSIVDARIRGDNSFSYWNDMSRTRQHVDTSGFRRNFKEFPENQALSQKIVSFGVGSIVAKHTEKWFIWSEYPECDIQPDAERKD